MVPADLVDHLAAVAEGAGSSAGDLAKDGELRICYRHDPAAIRGSSGELREGGGSSSYTGPIHMGVGWRSTRPPPSCTRGPFG